MLGHDPEVPQGLAFSQVTLSGVLRNSQLTPSFTDTFLRVYRSLFRLFWVIVLAIATSVVLRG